VTEIAVTVFDIHKIKADSLATVGGADETAYQIVQFAIGQGRQVGGEVVPAAQHHEAIHLFADGAGLTPPKRLL
jgi:hypothetical protein